jgi:sarcosine oxidase gamma subunit
MQQNLKIQRVLNRKKSIHVSLLLVFAMISTLILAFISPASSTVTVPQRTDGGTTLEVSVPADQSVSGNSVNFDLSQSIKRPTTWSDDQYVAVEVALTTAGSDSASVFRGSGGCVVDLSSSANTATYSSTQGDGLVSITGVANQIFVMNDQSPQLSLQGRLDDVLTALQKVQIRCNAQSDLVSKYVRLGAVPSIFQNTSGCTASASIYPCNGPLLYLFSTQHYYQLRYFNHTSTNPALISVLFNDAKTRTIDVDGSARSGATARYGWVATLSEQDEIRLTNALNQPAVSMIGTTDNSATWTWDATAWGSSTGNTVFANSGSNCATSESDFRWIGPDVWCLRVPAKNNDTAKQYWAKDAIGQWVPQATSTNALIDFNSSINSVRGFNLYHAWGWTNVNTQEPNASGNFVYQASSVATWDDTTAPGPWKNYFIEYCDPNHTCPPPNEAVASIQLKLTQTITFTGWSASYSDEVNSLTRGTSTSGLTVTHSSQSPGICGVSSDPSSGNIQVTLFNPGICTIRASQPGNDNYLAATAVDQSFTSSFSSSSNTAPTVALVDPRVSSVFLPQLAISGATNVLACLDESNSSGVVLNSPVLKFDVSAKGSAESTGTGSAAITGDRTTSLRIRHTRANVIDTLNSSSGISVFLTSGNFAETKYVRLRVVPIATSTSLSGTCDDAVSTASSTIEIRPLGLTNTLRKGTIQLK